MSAPRPKVQPKGGGAGRPALLERERELDALERALDRLGTGTGSLVFVEGSAGLGKTSLVAEAARRARDRDLLVRVARGGDIERQMPFSVARQLFEPLIARWSPPQRARLLMGSAALAQIALGPQQDEAKTYSDPFAATHGLYWLLANIADERPVFIAIDDGHWADPQSLRFVEYAAHRLSDLAALLVVAARPGEPGAPAELARLSVDAERLRPAPLTHAAVARLVASETGREPDPDFLDACIDVTGGNPFLVAEIARGLRMDGLEPESDMARTIVTLGSENVARSALVRLGRFGDDAIALASAIAVLAGAPQLRHAARLARVSGERALALTDEMRAAEILAPGLPLDFVHPLVRQAIYREQPEGERSAMHRWAAEVLAEGGADTRAIAPHLLACAPNGDQWVVERLREAARAARAEGAPEAVKTYLERAVKEPPDDDVEDLFEIGHALYHIAPASAPPVLTEVAVRSADPGLRVAALRIASLAHLTSGNVPAAVDATIEALAATAPTDRELRLVLEAQLYCFAMASGGRGDPRAQRIRAVATPLHGATPGEVFARHALACELFLACEPVDDVVAAAGDFPPLPWQVAGVRTIVPVFAGRILALSGRWDEARAAFARFTDFAHEVGNLNGASYGHAFLGEVERLAGRLADAEAEARIALDLAGALGSFSPAVWQATVLLVAILIERGELDPADALLQPLPTSFGPGDMPVYPWPIELRGYLRLARGDLQGAAEDLLSLGATIEAMGWLNPALPPWRQESVPALVALGRTREASELIAVAEERAGAFGAPHLMGAVLRSKALTEPRRPQIETLRRSVAMLEMQGAPDERARSLVELGAALRRDGNRSEARAPLHAAIELAHACGAQALAERAREELLATGARPRRSARSGIAALTPSELRTARLAAEGLNNREIAERLFVTRRTVETHLTHVYDKLEIAGRNELSAALAAP